MDGLSLFHAVFVHLESFPLKLLLVALVTGLLQWLALLILRSVIVRFERFRHRVLHLLDDNTRRCGGFPGKSGPMRYAIAVLMSLMGPGCAKTWMLRAGRRAS